MMNRIWWIEAVMCVTAAALVTGCGGGGPGFDPNTTGTANETVVEISSGSWISGAEVETGGRLATSTSPAGAFSVAGIPPGAQLITVTLPSPYVLASSTPMYCTVVAGQTTVLPGPIYVVTSQSPPPPAI